MKNRENGEDRAVLEAAGQVAQTEEGQTKAAENIQKRQKSKKRRNGFRMPLLILQHVALSVMVFAMIVVTVCTTVRVEGVRWGGTFSFYSDPGTSYEDSSFFDMVFGSMAADIIRFGVVSSQMETKGEYDADKPVDVTAFNYRTGKVPEQYVTASYRLEDLLKWQSYGFTYETKKMTRAEAAEFFVKAAQATSVDTESGNRNTSDAGEREANGKEESKVSVLQAGREKTAEYVIVESDSGFVEDYQPMSELGNHAQTTKTETVSTNEADYDDEDEALYEYDLLVNRYQTVEGKNLEAYASNWKEYYELCDNVRQAAASLTYNYSDYLDYGEHYNAEKTNVRYLIEKSVGEETLYYSNMEKDSAYRKHVMRMMGSLAEDEGEAELPTEKYIYYCPGDMTYLTNTSIEESTMRQIVQEYEYAYPESVRIWLSVDTTYPVKDAFAQGKEYLPHLWQWVAAAFLAGILYLILFVYQTVVTGRAYNEAGEKYIRLNAFDKISTEASLLIAAMVMFLVFWVMIVATEIPGIDPTDIDFYREAIHTDWFKAVVFVGGFAADVIFTFFFYSLVRRIKARTLYRNSLTCRLVERLKKFAWNVYDNGSIVVRTWIPYCAFLAVNLLLLLLAVNAGNMLLVLFAGIIDILVGILLYKDVRERQGIVEGIETIAGGQVEHQIDTQNLHGDNKTLANAVNSIGKGIKEAVEISMKDERMKADLITNVSHDIKTPLTSIINYVDLLKRERVDNEKIQNYIRVLDEKSQRLKQLTDDLVEASKITSGNISLHFERINLTELMNQAIGEFSEKFETKSLTTVMNINTREAVIEADSRRIWRVMENLFNNVYKYAMPGTRVYVTLDMAKQSAEDGRGMIEVAIKNISENPLLCKPEELTERFIRGDESRTTEGSGLGLSIAKNLTLAQKGSFEIELDGDLFKVILTFPLAKEE